MGDNKSLGRDEEFDYPKEFDENNSEETQKEVIVPNNTNSIESNHIDASSPEYKSILVLLEKLIIASSEKEEPVITLNLNKIDPKEAKDTLEKAYMELQLDVILVEFLQGNEFNKIKIEELFKQEHFKDTPADKKELYLQNAIEKLSKNDTLKNDDFVQKLFKLKKIEDLVKDSIVLTKFKEENKSLINLLKFNIDLYIEKSIKKHNLNNSSDIPAIEKIKDELIEIKEELDDKNKIIESLNLNLEKYNNSEIELKEKIKVLEEKDKNVSIDFSVLEETIDIDFTNNHETILLDLLNLFRQMQQEIENLKTKLQDSTSSEIVKELMDENASLTEELKKLKEEKNNKENELDSLLKNDNSKIETTNNIDLNIKNKKSIPKSLKIIFGVILTIAFLYGSLLIVGSMLGLDEEDIPTAPTNYIEPAPTTQQVEKDIALPTPVENNAYDFNKELSLIELQEQKFDIYTDNYEKIRVNGKDFLTGQIINGYEFVRANSAGKILFINNEKNPVWIEMKR